MPSKSKGASESKTATVSTRDRLVDAGLELMRKRGYGATGLQEILEAARVPKGSFYHHFGRKEEVGSAVLDRYFALAANHAHHVLGDHRQAPLKRLRRY